MLPLAAMITVGLIALVTVGLIVWDIIVATNNIPNGLDTISGRMKAWGKQTLLLPWLWAGLYGHFWGPIKAGQLMPMKVSLPILIFLTWGVTIVGIWCRQNGITINTWPVFLLVLNLGAIAGACLWPQ